MLLEIGRYLALSDVLRGHNARKWMEKKLLIFFFLHDYQPSTYPLISRSQEEQYLNDNFKLLEKGSKLVASRRQQLHHNDHVIFNMLFPMQIPMQNDNLSIALKSCYFCVILVRDAEKKQKNTQKELTWVKFWRNSVHHSICTLIICPNSWITLIARPDNIRWFELSLRRRRHLRQSYRILQLHSATMSCSIEEETIIVTTLGLAIGSVKTKKKDIYIQWNVIMQPADADNASILCLFVQ